MSRMLSWCTDPDGISNKAYTTWGRRTHGKGVPEWTRPEGRCATESCPVPRCHCRKGTQLNVTQAWKKHPKTKILQVTPGKRGATHTQAALSSSLNIKNQKGTNSTFSAENDLGVLCLPRFQTTKPGPLAPRHATGQAPGYECQPQNWEVERADSL